MKNKKINHYILGFERRTSGAFEHSWELAKNLQKRNFNIKYFSHWWDSEVKQVNLNNENTKRINPKKIGNMEGIFHLQTHTWENAGYLDKIIKNPNSKLIYNLHAIIPYFYLNGEDKHSFLEGTLPNEIYQKIINKTMKIREISQLTAINKADYLFTISKSHKKVLERMNIEKPIYVFENPSDLDSLNENTFYESKKEGLKLREELNSENIIIYCGNLYEKKGSTALFNSFNKIKENYKHSKLILLGSGENNLERLSKIGLKEKNLKEIILVPWINKNTLEGKKEFLKYYYASDILIQPMITDELYSKTVIDAMKMGLPTITCKSPYTIGSSKNSEEIFNSYVRFKENPAEIKKIIKSAKEKVERENTWESYISRMESIIKY